MPPNMLPTAGLFLPQTLNQNLYPGPTEDDARSMRSTGRRSFDSRSGEHDFLHSQTSPRLSDRAGLGGVPTENDVFVIMVRRIRDDVVEALRLYNVPAVMDHFENYPTKKQRVDGIFADMVQALKDVGVYVGKEQVGNGGLSVAKIKHKANWVFGDRQKLMTRENALTTCHNSLSSAIQMMQTVEMSEMPLGRGADAPMLVELEETQPMRLQVEQELLRGPHSRKKWRRTSSRNLSTASLHNIEPSISEAPNVDEPVELPGSFPDESTDNLDLYASPPNPKRTIEPFQTHSSVHENKSQAQNMSESLPTSQSMTSLHSSYRSPVRRKPLIKHTSLPTSLPDVPKTSSLYADLWQFVERSDSLAKRQSVQTGTDNLSISSEPISPSDSVLCGSSTSEFRTAGTSPSEIVSNSESLVKLLAPHGKARLVSIPPLKKSPIRPPSTPHSESSSLAPQNPAASAAFRPDSAPPAMQPSSTRDSAVALAAVLTQKLASMSTSPVLDPSMAEPPRPVLPSPTPSTPSVSKTPSLAVSVDDLTLAQSNTSLQAFGGQSNPIQTDVTPASQVQKPLTTQEKRRRAHTGRLQMAYGREE